MAAFVKRTDKRLVRVCRGGTAKAFSQVAERAAYAFPGKAREKCEGESSSFHRYST